jgi:hypothetical protein
MALSRAEILKFLLPGLPYLFGLGVGRRWYWGVQRLGGKRITKGKRYAILKRQRYRNRI